MSEDKHIPYEDMNEEQKRCCESVGDFLYEVKEEIHNLDREMNYSRLVWDCHVHSQKQAQKREYIHWGVHVLLISIITFLSFTFLQYDTYDYKQGGNGNNLIQQEIGGSLQNYEPKHESEKKEK